MDLSLYGSILRRFWKLAAVGAALAVLLAGLSYVRVSPSGIAYRNPEVWQTQSMLLLTQSGFPWGRTEATASAGTLQSFTELYAQFANSDEVERRMRRAGAKKSWKIVARPVAPQVSGSSLPVIALSGQARSARDSQKAAALATRAFISYVKDQQQVAHIPAARRIHIELLERSATPRPELLTPRSKTLPLMVFLAVLTATVGLALVLERRYPRPHLAEASATGDSEGAATGEEALPAVRTVQRWG